MSSRGLFLNGGDDMGMAVACGADRDARGKVQKHVAVNVFDHCAAPALGYQRVIAGVGRRHEFGVGLEHALGFGPGQSHFQVGAVLLRAVAIMVSPARSCARWSFLPP